MDLSSTLKTMGQWLALACKSVVILAAGALIAGVCAAFFHFREVRTGLERVERLVNQGLLEEANSRAETLEPWTLCFPGRYRECAAIRVRCLARLGRPREAALIAENMRADVDQPLRRPEWKRLATNPLFWLQQTSLCLVSGLASGFYPPTLENEWAGYEALLEELVSVRNLDALNRLSDDLTARFPRHSISILAASAKVEADPPIRPIHFSAHTPPAPIPSPASTQAASAVSTNGPAGAETGFPETVVQPESAAWGIVTNTRAVACNPQTGQPIRALHVGDVLVIEGETTLRKAPALTGTLILNNRNVPDLAFRADDLEIRTGSFAKVSSREVALRSRLAEIQEQENVLLLKLARETARMTPEEKAFRESQSRFDAFRNESDAQKAMLEKTNGAERMKILDRLRAMKYQEQALLRDLQSRKQAFEHAGGDSGRDAVEREMRALRQEKEAVLKHLAGLFS